MHVNVNFLLKNLIWIFQKNFDNWQLNNRAITIILNIKKNLIKKFMRSFKNN